MSASPAQLQNLIGHRFTDPKLLERALTHTSWAYEAIAAESDTQPVDNESLEFVGDSVLGLVIAERLFEMHPDASEGDLTLMKHSLVSTKTLARVAETLGLGEYVRIGRGEKKTGAPKRQSLLANTLEAVIAAVFLDGGYVAARVFIGRLFDTELKKANPADSLDYKSMLQARLQAAKLNVPQYSVLKTSGPPHSRTFLVEASWEGGTVKAEGRTIKAAEMSAAAAALELLPDESERPRKRGTAK